MERQDYILCECAPESLEAFVVALEESVAIAIIKMPAICMTMVKAEDSVDSQPFYLGEALTTECEVTVDGIRGIGICLGDEPVRSYCLAFMDAYVQTPNADLQSVNLFLDEQEAAIAQAAKAEQALILRTRVDFKLMEQD